MITGGEQTHDSSVMDQVGDNIIHHVSNSSLDHPLIHLPHVFGIDLSVTKHVLMLWIVALTVGLVVILPIQRYVQQRRLIPTGLMNVLEIVVSFVRDSIVKPNVGPKWVNSWAPLILTFLFFIFFANAIGMIPIFDVLGVINRFNEILDSNIATKSNNNVELTKQKERFNWWSPYNWTPGESLDLPASCSSATSCFSILICSLYSAISSWYSDLDIIFFRYGRSVYPLCHKC